MVSSTTACTFSLYPLWVIKSCNKSETTEPINAGGVRNASHPHRVFSDVAAAVMAEDGSGDGAAGADGTTTLQDVSRKDRLQRMDQRRIR